MPQSNISLLLNNRNMRALMTHKGQVLSLLFPVVQSLEPEGEFLGWVSEASDLCLT